MMMGDTILGDPMMPLAPQNVEADTDRGCKMSTTWAPLQSLSCNAPMIVEEEPKCVFDNPGIVAQYHTKSRVASPNSSPKLAPKAQSSRLGSCHLKNASINSHFNLFAKPFTPSMQPEVESEAHNPNLESASPHWEVPSGEWELERVREFAFFGELEDYDELEQLEKAAVASLEGRSESDYTSSEEDFETTRMKQTEELRNFSKQFSKQLMVSDDAQLVA